MKYNIEKMNIGVFLNLFKIFDFFFYKWLKYFGLSSGEAEILTREEKISKIQEFKKKVAEKKVENFNVKYFDFHFVIFSHE